MLSAEEIRAIVKEAHRYNVKVTAHSITNQSVYNAVINGVDAIEHGYSIDDTTLALMAKKGVFLVPTDGDCVTITQYAKLQYPTDAKMIDNIMGYRKNIAERLQRAIKKGVLIAAGSDDYIDFKLPFAEPSKRTLIGYYESGVSIPKLLQFATINASKQCNWGNVSGILKKGYFADIIAVDSNLDQNINAILNVHFVMKDGKVYIHKEIQKASK